jgi:hypothetical protein
MVLRGEHLARSPATRAQHRLHRHRRVLIAVLRDDRLPRRERDLLK